MKNIRFVRSLIACVLMAAVMAPLFSAGRQEATPELPVIQIYKVGEAMPDADRVWAHINTILAEEIGATVVVRHVPWGDYPDRIRLLLASGDDYDMHFDATWLLWPSLVASDALLDITDLLPRYAPNLYAHYREIGALADATARGRILGLPVTDTGTSRAWATVNQRWIDELDIDVDFSTIEGVVEYARIVTENVDAVDYPIQQIWFANPRFENVMWAMFTKHSLSRPFAEGNHGFTFNIRDAHHTGSVEIVPIEQTEAYLEAARWRRQFSEWGWIPRDAMLTEGGQFLVRSGNSAVILRSFRDQFDAVSAEARDRVELIGHRMYPDSYAEFTGFFGNGFSVNRNAANPELALQFMDWVYRSQENYDLVLYGILGETYELVVEDGIETVQLLPGQDDSSAYPMTHGRWGFWRDGRQRPGAPDGSVRLYTEAIPSERDHATNVVSPLAGFVFDPSNVESQIALRNSIRDEYEPPISHGFVPDVEAAIADLNNRLQQPTEAIRQEMQRQVDAFIAGR